MTTKRRKDPFAVALGRRGSKARMIKLTPAQRQEIARKAVLARWAKYKAKRSKALET